MTETTVTRGEFDLLRGIVNDNARRLDTIDNSGTRGVGVLQSQITDLAKDVSSLSTRLDTHDREHKQDTRDRRAARWRAAALAIAVVAAVDGPTITLLIRH